MVIVGAGFGGLYATRALRDAPVEITVVDRFNHHVFQPLLHQVATAGLAPSDIASPIRTILLASGARHAYFSHPEWESYAPGLKTLEDALAIRRLVLLAVERAEREPDPVRRQALLTFVVVGGGPTGVELAGAIGVRRRPWLPTRSPPLDPRALREASSWPALVE